MYAKYTFLDYVLILLVSMRRELIYILRGEYSSRPELAMILACSVGVYWPFEDFRVELDLYG